MALDPTKRPGDWVLARSHIRSLRVWVLIGMAAVLAAVVVWSSFAAHHAWLALVVLGAMLALRPVANREITVAGYWLRGAQSEALTGETLNALRKEGFTVVHDVERRSGGNIDHVVSGPTGVYLIETKHRRYEAHDLPKAKRQAARLHDELGVWVTPVICIDQRRPGEPARRDGVWIVTRERLLDWLRAQRNAVLEFERLAAWAEKQ